MTEAVNSYAFEKSLAKDPASMEGSKLTTSGCQECEDRLQAPRLPGLDLLWKETTGDPGVSVAVLDGPVDLSHPCFAGAALRVVETLVANDADRGPACKHGTHVTSVIFGQHGGPVPGIAPGCRGFVVPVFKSGQDGSLAPCSQIDLARAITQAVEKGAQVINISGGQIDSAGEAHQLLANAVRLCAAEGVLIVAAAGNDGCPCLHVPAALPSVLAVGAMDANGAPLGFSNWGEAYRGQGVLALGENIPGAVPGGGIAPLSGTSYATPIVSGVVALMLSLQLKRGQPFDPQAVRKAILSSAVGCEEQPVSDCRRLLVGRLNIPRAVSLLAKGGIMETSDHIGGSGLPEVQAQEPTVSAGSAALAEPATRADPAALAEPTAPGEPAGVQAAEATAPEPLASELAASSCGSAAAPPPMDELPGGGVAGQITASDCSCGQPPSLVYALGQLGHDFGTEARRDSFIQAGVANPDDPAQLLAHLSGHPPQATAVTWTLTQETTPIYALQPGGSFAGEAYARLREFLNQQLNEGVERVSIPGYVSGHAQLSTGQTVPIIRPELRGMHSWSTPALVEAVLGKPPTKKEDLDTHNEKAADIANFLERVYYEIRNLGLSPQERALNFSATNAFQVERVFQKAIQADRKLDSIDVERSPICRPDSDCWDVKLTFFHPTKRLEQARDVYRFTVDVSDVVPVTVGKVRNWYEI
ncbi:MAG: PatA/PatG family cyanobactin maturation protease [Acidobacteriota bacterium]